MKKSHYFLLTTLCPLLFAVFLCGCGSGPGSPGTCDTSKTGVILSAEITPTYNGKNTDQVDVEKDVCSAGPPPVYEFFSDHTATVTINSSLLNPNPTIQPGKLYVEKYTIEYRIANESIGAPPIESDIVYDTSITIIPPSSGTGTNTVEVTGLKFVDVPRKNKYLNDMLSGAYSSALNNPYLLNNYTAIYTFEGTNDYGEPFCFVATKSFYIGNYDYCT